MRGAIFAAITAAACVLAGAAPAQAQFRFGLGFGFGNGGGFQPYGGVGYGNVPYGPGYGGYYPYGGFNNDYGPYVPRSSGYGPYRGRRPSYSPRYTYGARPTVRIAAPAGDGLPIKIVRPPDTAGPIAYRLNAYEYVIEPGETQSLANDRDWIVTFDRGGSSGTARYRMAGGTYTFRDTAAVGRDLFHDPDVGKLLAPTK